MMPEVKLGVSSSSSAAAQGGEINAGGDFTVGGGSNKKTWWVWPLVAVVALILAYSFLRKGKS